LAALSWTARLLQQRESDALACEAQPSAFEGLASLGGPFAWLWRAGISVPSLHPHWNATIDLEHHGWAASVRRPTLEPGKSGIFQELLHFGRGLHGINLAAIEQELARPGLSADLHREANAIKNKAASAIQAGRREGVGYISSSWPCWAFQHLRGAFGVSITSERLG